MSKGLKGALFIRLAFATCLWSLIPVSAVQATVGKNELRQNSHFNTLTSLPEKVSLSVKPLPAVSQINSYSTSRNGIAALSVDEQCTPQVLTSGTVEQKVEAISLLSKVCISEHYWVKSDFTLALYNQALLAGLIGRIEASAADYNADENSGVAQLLEVTRAAYYLADDDPAYDFNNDTQPLRDSLVLALQAVNTSPGMLDSSEYHANWVMYDWLYLIYNLQLQVEMYSELNGLLNAIAEEKSTDEQWLANVWRIYDVFSRPPEGSELEALIAADDTFLTRVERWSTDRFALGIADYVPHGPMYWLANHGLGYNSIESEAKTLFTQLLSEFPADSTWFMSLISGYQFTLQCEELAPAYCPGNYRETLKNRLFPHTYTFDDGRFVVKTGLDESQVQQLFSAAQQVKSAFFRLTGNTLPVAGDNAENLTIYVSQSRQHYEDYQSYLFNLGSDNGGIYIEEDATFYTYQRTAAESIYSLEELFRHEYVHYLEARYQIHGSYGTNPFHESPHRLWEVEGLAEYLAGATQHSGVIKRESIMRRFGADADQWMTAEDVFTSTTGFAVYPYGMMMHAYMAEQYPDTHKQLFSVIHADDIDAYNRLVTQLIADSDFGVGFTSYIHTQRQMSETWWEPVTPWLPAEKRLVTTLNDVQLAYDAAGLADFTCEITNATLENGYQCVASDVSFASLKALHNYLDSGLGQLVDSASFTEFNDVCYPSTVEESDNNVTANLICEGSLGADTADNLPPFVTPEASFWLIDGHPAKVTVTAFDPEGSALIFSWQQIAGTTVNNLTDTDTQTASFTAPLIEADELISFEVVVSDGENSVVKTVDVQLIKADYHSPVFETATTSFDFYRNDDADVTLAVNSPDGEPLSFNWEYYDNEQERLPLDISALTSSSLYIPHAEWQAVVPESERLATLMTVTADDGISTSSAYVYVYLYNSRRPDYGDTIEADDLIDFDFSSSDSIVMQVNATSTSGDAISYTWEQVYIDDEESVDLSLDELNGNTQEIDITSFTRDDYATGRIVLSFNVIMKDSASQKTTLVRAYITKANDTVEFENDSVEYEFTSNDTIELSVDATSTLGEAVTYTWQQVYADSQESKDLQLGELDGASQTIDMSSLSEDDYAPNGRIILEFTVTADDSFSEKTASVRVYINYEDADAGGSDDGEDEGGGEDDSGEGDSGSGESGGSNSGGTPGEGAGSDSQKNSGGSGGGSSSWWLLGLGVAIWARRYAER